MDDDSKLNELLVKAYEAAPPPIQAFIDENRLADFMLDIQISTKMPVDVAGEVSNRLLLTLLGAIAPTELPTELSEAGVPAEKIDAVLKAANDSIFIPLREGMRAVAAVPPAQPEPQPAERVTLPPLVPVPDPLPVPAPPVEVTKTPQVAPPVYSAPVVPVSEDIPAPAMRTMAHDIESMKDGAERSPSFFSAPSEPIQPSEPPKQPVPAVRPTPPDIAPVPEVVIPRTTTPTHKEVVSTLQKYGIDPYHEPID